jgi:hypothetical protein
MCVIIRVQIKEVKNMALKNEQLIELLNSALDVLLGMFGREWLIRWAIDNGLNKEEIINWIYDDEEIVTQVWQEVEEEEKEG